MLPIFEVDSFYEEVSQEIKEMYNYLNMCRTNRLNELAEQEQQQTRKLEERISLISVGFGIPLLIMGFLNINIVGVTTQNEGMSFLSAFLVTFCGGALLSFGVLYLLRKNNNK